MGANHAKLDKERKAKAFKQFLIFLGLAGLLFAIDIISKWAVQLNLKPGSPLEVIPNFFYITLSYNTGAAFSLGANWGVGGRILGIGISVVMSVLIFLYWYKRNEEFNTFERAIAALMLSGAVGNLIDRSLYWVPVTGFDGVIDFFQFYLGGGPSAGQSLFNPFATFNPADAFLVVGIILFLIDTIVTSVKEGKGSELRKDPRLTKKAEGGKMLSSVDKSSTKNNTQNVENKPSIETPSNEDKAPEEGNKSDVEAPKA